MRAQFVLFAAGLALLAGPGAAQLGLPVPPPVPIADPVTGQLAGTLGALERGVAREAERLLELRTARIDRLLRRERDAIERDAAGAPARRGILLALDASPAELGAAAEAGFEVIAAERLEGLDLGLVRLRVPEGRRLATAEAELAALMPGATISADHLYFSSGYTASMPIRLQSAVAVPISTPVGVIDGGVDPAAGLLAIKGIASGAPRASNHGSAIVSLLRHAGVRQLRLADVYGNDPAGGNALAVARALGWLVAEGSEVVNISLVGPPNALVERAIGRAQDKGVVIVAAVGNDGPAAPPAYPASYVGVVAVTGVDRRNRPLIEAGRALHIDYAAPAADVVGLDARGRRIKLRGTSYASPLAAARVAAALSAGGSWRLRLDREAVDLGKPGPDPRFGRGLLCGRCRPS
ncbi:MAG: S8 family serine peptidase [Sphingopyxis sp.]|nr:S8 family serine peptidase [Sphingopyxis sp.]